MLERVNSYRYHNSISKPWKYQEMKNPDEKVKIVFQLVKRKAYEVSDYCMYQRQSMVTVYRLAS